MPNVPSAKVAAAKIAAAKAKKDAEAGKAGGKVSAKTSPKAKVAAGTRGRAAKSTKGSSKKSSKSRQSEPTTAERRRAIEADVQEFLKKGQKIEQVPTGVSGQDRFGRSKHIVLGRGKSR